MDVDAHDCSDAKLRLGLGREGTMTEKVNCWSNVLSFEGGLPGCVVRS